MSPRDGSLSAVRRTFKEVWLVYWVLDAACAAAGRGDRQQRYYRRSMWLVRPFFHWLHRIAKLESRPAQGFKAFIPYRPARTYS